MQHLIWKTKDEFDIVSNATFHFRSSELLSPRPVTALKAFLLQYSPRRNFVYRSIVVYRSMLGGLHVSVMAVVVTRDLYLPLAKALLHSRLFDCQSDSSTYSTEAPRR